MPQLAAPSWRSGALGRSAGRRSVRGLGIAVEAGVLSGQRPRHHCYYTAVGGIGRQSPQTRVDQALSHRSGSSRTEGGKAALLDGCATRRPSCVHSRLTLEQHACSVVAGLTTSSRSRTRRTPECPA